MRIPLGSYGVDQLFVGIVHRLYADPCFQGLLHGVAHLYLALQLFVRVVIDRAAD